MKRVVFAVILLICSLSGFTQPVARLKIIGAAIGDSVVLRWAVLNADGWPVANTAGYVLERTELDVDNKVSGKSRQNLPGKTLFPWTYSSLESRLSRQDTLALVAAQCLYGKSVRTISMNQDLVGALQEANDESESRHGFALIAADLSAKAADLLAWRWVDRNIKPGHKYIYTIRCAALKNQVISDTAACVLQPSEFIALQPLNAPILLPDEHVITVKWKKYPHITAYFIERSEDGIHFSKVNNQPYMDWQQKGISEKDSLAYVDSLPANYQKYYYRISGINPFSQITPPGSAVSGMAIDRTPPPSPVGVFGKNTRDGEVELQWENPSSSEPVSGIVIARSPDIAGPYNRIHEGILPVSATTFTDKSNWQYGSNFYAVGIIDTAGNIGWAPQVYVIMEDFAPPAKPFGLTGSIDTAGWVSLTWLMGADPDLKGYNIYAANQPDHTFIPVADTLVTDTVFRCHIDLHNLTAHIYYRIRAFDYHQKESEFSEILEIKKPDIIAPDAAVFDKYLVDGNTVLLQWRPSSSIDVVKQELLRRQAEKEWQVIQVFDPGITTFKDSITNAGFIWDYTLIAIDDSGLKSQPSFPVSIKTASVRPKNTLHNFRIIWDAPSSIMQMNWEKGTEFERLLLYRAFENEGYELLVAIAGTANEFTDKPVRKGKYQYLLKPVLKNGAEGIVLESNIIFIN